MLPAQVTTAVHDLLEVPYRQILGSLPNPGNTIRSVRFTAMSMIMKITMIVKDT
jgi:hypothetical protein